MKISKEEFLNTDKKAVTLIGMSGAGKSHISCQLEGWGWYNYSCDYIIGADYLKDELPNAEDFSTEDISALSEYLGRLGSPDHGGFLLDKFKQRQKAYYDAEVSALFAMGEVLEKAQTDFVHDSTGSLCEIVNEEVMEKIGQETLFVYLKTDEVEERKVLQRAYDYPKPLFFPPAFLEEKLEQFFTEFGISGVGEMHPDDFSRWVFPKLFESRKPKYQRLADLYGVTINAGEFANLQSAEEFVDIIARHLD